MQRDVIAHPYRRQQEAQRCNKLSSNASDPFQQRRRFASRHQRRQPQANLDRNRFHPQKRFEIFLRRSSGRQRLFLDSTVNFFTLDPGHRSEPPTQEQERNGGQPRERRQHQQHSARQQQRFGSAEDLLL